MSHPGDTPFSRKFSSDEQKKQVAGLKSTAFREYLSARILFDKHLLQPACIFANTCIEKELKVCLIAMGFEKKVRHDSLTLFQELKKYDPERCKFINEEFLAALSNIYQSRYHDGLPLGYRYVIVKNKFLAELDSTYIELTQATTTHIDNKATSPFERSKAAFTEDLYKNNFILNKTDKGKFLNNVDYVNELILTPGHVVFEVNYTIDLDTDQKRFQYDIGAATFESDGTYILNLAYEKHRDLRVEFI